MNAARRYARQTMLPEIGEDGQRRIMQAAVLIVGLGGLGCPVSLYLSGAGIGRIGLADPDTVSESNLHRQLLYETADVGRQKVECAAHRLSGIAPAAVIATYREGLMPGNADEVIGCYDIVVDCCDNHATRYLIADVCRRLGKPWVHGAISGFTGMVSVFMPDSVVGYEELFPDRDELSGRVASAGVIGPTAGVIGCIEAAETLKLAAGMPTALAGRLLTADLRTMDFQTLDL